MFKYWNIHFNISLPLVLVICYCLKYYHKLRGFKQHLFIFSQFLCFRSPGMTYLGPLLQGLIRLQSASLGWQSHLRHSWDRIHFCSHRCWHQSVLFCLPAREHAQLLATFRWHSANANMAICFTKSARRLTKLELKFHVPKAYKHPLNFAMSLSQKQVLGGPHAEGRILNGGKKTRK